LASIWRPKSKPVYLGLGLDVLATASVFISEAEIEAIGLTSRPSRGRGEKVEGEALAEANVTRPMPKMWPLSRGQGHNCDIDE